MYWKSILFVILVVVSIESILWYLLPKIRLYYFRKNIKRHDSCIYRVGKESYLGIVTDVMNTEVKILYHDRTNRQYFKWVLREHIFYS